MESFYSNWNLQICASIAIFVVYFALLWWNYRVVVDTSICKAELFSVWTKPYLLLAIGGSLGQTLMQLFTMLMSKLGYSLDGKLRHPKATELMLFISISQSVTLVLTYLDIFPYTCKDHNGVRSSPLIWLEWLSTVPFMFFLVSMLDVKRMKMLRSDIWIETCGGFAIPCLFLGVIPKHSFLGGFFFLLANILMTIAITWQQYVAMEEYSKVKKLFDAQIADVDNMSRDIVEQLQISQCKLNCAWFMSIGFSAFPVIYYFNLFQVIDDDVSFLCTYFASYLSKVLFAQLITNSHITILDPNKFLLVDEKKKSEESRLMFMRYIFHEVRVPLNSVSLGLQLLQDNDKLNCHDKETILMMREATSFMTETLNDVLSLQKIQQGMQQLEYKHFSPSNLVYAVINNFK